MTETTIKLREWERTGPMSQKEWCPKRFCVPKMLHVDDSKGKQKYVNVKHLMTYLIASIYVRSQRKLGEQTPATTPAVMRHRSLGKLPGPTLASVKMNVDIDSSN